MCVYTIEDFRQLRFDGDHFNHDSENHFSVHHDSPTSKMVDHGVPKTSLPISEHTLVYLHLI